MQVCLRPGAFRAICTVSKFQGIETVFLQVFTVSKSKSRRYFCKCVFASGRVSPPFVPSRNLKESRLSFCKVLPPQNHNGDDICCKLLFASGRVRPPFVPSRNLKISRRLVASQQIVAIDACARDGAFSGPFLPSRNFTVSIFLTILQIVATGAVVLSHCFCSKPSPPAAAFRPLVKKYDHDNQNMIFPPADKGASRRRRW